MSRVPESSVDCVVMLERLFRSTLEFSSSPQFNSMIEGPSQDGLLIKVVPFTREHFSLMALRHYQRSLIICNIPELDRAVATSTENLSLHSFIEADIIRRVRCLELSENLVLVAHGVYV